MSILDAFLALVAKMSLPIAGGCITIPTLPTSLPKVK